MHLYYNRQSTVVQVASSLIQYHDNMGYPAQNDKRLSHLIILIKKEPCFPASEVCGFGRCHF